MLRQPLLLAALSCLALCARPASADDDPSTSKARTEYVAGQKEVEQQHWGEALAAFERSLALRPHALTLFNIGVCERNLGRYTRARRTLKRAIERNVTASGVELAASYLEETTGHLAHIESVLVRIDLGVEPADAALAVDGRPLSLDAEGSTTMVAGIDAPGPGKVLPKTRFTVLLDPGGHVFTLTRQGFSTINVTKSWPASTKDKLELSAVKLPARIRVRADRDGAVVRVGDVDVGVAPVEVDRPAGAYDVVVTKPGFVTYKSSVDVRPGEQLDLSAQLPQETIPLTKKWWFWTAASVAVAGAATATYFLTRPEPTRPAADGGGLGWVVSVP